MQREIAELERVELRDQWPDEERDFTPWLADNISHLSNVLDVNLEVQDTEADVGGYYADIYATDLEGEKDVIIENQYNISDHKHFGQSLVYAGGFDADIIVWLAEGFDDPHIDAIQWFNDRTDNTTGFFAVEVSLVQIKDSPVAPRFDVVERPSSWTPNESETEREHRRFWHGFEQRLKERGWSEYSRNQPGSSASYTIPKRFDGAYTRLASTVNDRVECTLRIIDESGEFQGLEKESVEEGLRTAIADMETEELTESIIESIEWMSRPGNKYDKITIYYPGPVDRSDATQWPQYYDWLIDAVRAYDQVFSAQL